MIFLQEAMYKRDSCSEWRDADVTSYPNDANAYGIAEQFAYMRPRKIRRNEENIFKRNLPSVFTSLFS
jgi:hypothetical protein